MKKTNSEKSVQVDLILLLNPSGIYEERFIKKMDGSKKQKIRTIVFICLVLAISGIIGFGYFCNDKVCALSKKDLFQTELSSNKHSHNGKSQLSLINNPGLSYDEVQNDDFQNGFDIDKYDVMVFLHIQKTGGTSFGKHLVRDLDLKRPCTCQRKKKRCYCFRPHRNENWLFSRYSIGWKCGLHADFTELTGCVDQELDKNEGESAKRRYFYITLLRSPIPRYLSEFRHVKRGATWKNSRHFCMGRQATAKELPNCYEGIHLRIFFMYIVKNVFFLIKLLGENWSDVELDEFTSCESNLASNRQTRMLADLALVNCYNRTSMNDQERNYIMLESAKRNLKAMSYFGLTEHQKISQYIFEETFNLRFAIPFEQHNATVSAQTFNSLTIQQQLKIQYLNELDIELYDFAKDLLFKRFERLKTKDNDFDIRFAHLGNIGIRNGITEFNWDSNLDVFGTSDNDNI
ncbi:unnamed protein product [Diamesa tonsa]